MEPVVATGGKRVAKRIGTERTRTRPPRAGAQPLKLQSRLCSVRQGEHVSA
jgi:hypothetical protein